MCVRFLPPSTLFTPTLPQGLPVVPATFPTAPTVTVSNFTALQNAVNAAVAGDVIAVDHTVSMVGDLSLPAHAGGMIYIISDAIASLPAFGVRVGPADAANMPKIVGTGSPVVALHTTGVANNWRIVGIEFKAPTTPITSGLMRLGTGSETSLAELPTGIILDRCYIHGDPTIGGRRGLTFNATDSALVHSYFDDWKEVGSDSQAWLIYQGARLLVWNNYGAGAAENMMIGGVDPSIKGHRPNNIAVVGNHFKKPTAWFAESWTIKNLWESKNSDSVLLAYNLFENIQKKAQAGYALNIKSANQDTTAPWSGTSNLTCLYNYLRNCSNGVTVSASDDGNSGPTMNVLIRHLFEEITLYGTAADGKPLMVLGGVVNVQIDHVTGIITAATTGTAEEYIEGPTLGGYIQGLNITNSIFSAGDNGFKGPGFGEGNATFNANCGVRWVFNKNAVIASPNGSGNYPAGNFFPANVAAMNFINSAAGNYGLTATSPGWQAATDGSNIGVNFSAVKQFADAAEAGTGYGV